MRVITRDGKTEPVRFDKITDRITELAKGLSSDIDPVSITQKISARMIDLISTKELDELSGAVALEKNLTHPDYGILASRICIDNHHKATIGNFEEVVNRLREHTDITGCLAPLVSSEIVNIANEHSEEIQSFIDYSRDFNLNCFGFKTLQRSYLLRSQGEIQERPQDMFMRVSLGIHGWDEGGQAAKETYDLMSQGYFIHATPTLFHAGTPYPQMSSCFLMGVEDSVAGIYQGLADAAAISKHAGGIGIHIHNVRAKGSYIRKTGGCSTGLIPFLKVYNDTARYIDQGGGKRKGSFAMYLEPHHPDILDFLEAKRPQGSDETRARDLFYALWISDLFMERVEKDEDWSVFCPDEVPGLSDTYGQEYRELYTEYEGLGKARTSLKARDVWKAIITSQIETGGPYMLYKDAANRKSNQKHYGTIRSSNLCCEIMEYSDHEEYAVCNLASIGLPRFVENGKFNYSKMRDVVSIIVRNLNKIIDRNYYPLEKARKSNMKHRPIGIGVQGLADTFVLMGMPFESAEAHSLKERII